MNDSLDKCSWPFCKNSGCENQPSTCPKSQNRANYLDTKVEGTSLRECIIQGMDNAYSYNGTNDWTTLQWAEDMLDCTTILSDWPNATPEIIEPVIAEYLKRKRSNG